MYRQNLVSSGSRLLYSDLLELIIWGHTLGSRSLLWRTNGSLGMLGASPWVFA